MLIGNNPCCIKVKETNLDSGQQVIYFIRTVTEKMISDIANELDVKYQIISDYKIPIVHKYIAFWYHKKMPYSTLILWKKKEDLSD